MKALDFLFGKSPLKKAASTGAPAAAPKVTTPAGIDVAAEAKKTVAAKLKQGVKDYGKSKVDQKRKQLREDTLPGRLATQFMEH